MSAPAWMWGVAIAGFLFVTVGKALYEFTVFERLVLIGLADGLLVLAFGFQMVTNAIRERCS